MKTIFCFRTHMSHTSYFWTHIMLLNFFLLSSCLSICYNSKLFLALPLFHLLPKKNSQSLVHLLCPFSFISFVSLVHLLYPFVFLSMFFLIHLLHLWTFPSTFFCGKLKCDYCCQSYFHVVIVLYLHLLISLFIWSCYDYLAILLLFQCNCFFHNESSFHCSVFICLTWLLLFFIFIQLLLLYSIVVIISSRICTFYLVFFHGTPWDHLNWCS